MTATDELTRLLAETEIRWGALGKAGFAVGLLLLSLIGHYAAFGLLTRLGRRTSHTAAKAARRHFFYPTRYLLLVLTLLFIISVFVPPYQATLQHALLVLTIILTAILLVAALNWVRDVLISRYDLTVMGNLQARKVHTQFRIVQRLLTFIIVMFALSVVLLTFDRIREIGISLLASAGIVGIIVGFAAQKSLSIVLAGIQVAIAQPIRIDDVVIVEGEWGRIEEIMLTYVVIKIWDERRMVVPINFFIEKPFQNWTRTTSQLMGTVLLYTDYTVPPGELRTEFVRVLDQHRLWDRRVGVLQVTDSNPNTVEIRLLMSAANAGELFDLRCEIREHMVGFFQQHYPDNLPRTRLEIVQPPSGTQGQTQATFVEKE